MKNVYIFSFTAQATALSSKLYQFYISQNINCLAYTLPKYCTSIHKPIEDSLQKQVEACFHPDAAIIFVSACGIAVRAIAPFIKHKAQDPCVLAIDEKGQYVIPLLSGHLGGGNTCAMAISKFLDATPVISTATDLNHKFAVDEFAKNNQLTISNMHLAKKVSVHLLHNLPVGICGILPKETLPEGLTTTTQNFGISISPFSTQTQFKETLHLIPKNMVLGIGCKKNTDAEALSVFVEEQLALLHLFPESIAAITSIDLKKAEPAILALANNLQVPFVTYTADELKKVKGSLSSSSFVQTITGVDNVCERAALAYTKNTTLIREKTIKEGMTLAISELPMTFSFQNDSFIL